MNPAFFERLTGTLVKETHLLLLLGHACLLTSHGDVLGLDAHDATTPAAADLCIVVELGLEVGGQSLQLLLVFLAHSSEGNARDGLLVHKLTQPRLALDDAVWHILLSAECRQPANHLDGVDIVSDDDKLGRFLLDKSGDVIQAILQYDGLLALVCTSGLLVLCHLQKTSLLGFPSLRHVLLAQLQNMCGLVLVDGGIELIDGWGHLDAHEHDLLGTLQSHILWPPHESSEITLGLNVSSQSVATSCLLEKWVLLSLLLCSGGERGLGQVLLSFRCHGCE